MYKAHIEHYGNEAHKRWDRYIFRGSKFPPSVPDYKNIKLHLETYERLKEHGNMDESFDDLINRILDDWEPEHAED